MMTHPRYTSWRKRKNLPKLVERNVDTTIRTKRSPKRIKGCHLLQLQKAGHFKRECRALKKKQDGGNDNKNKDNNFVAMISEAFSLEEEKSDARFDENRFRTIPREHEISKETVSTEIPVTTEGNNDDSFLNHQQVEASRSTRQQRQRTFSHDFEMYIVEGDRKGLIREYPIIYNLDEEQENKVCKLIKSLYGLKQAPKQ
nr:hypothetical protein [Tanacetum cinerariifolium]